MKLFDWRERQPVRVGFGRAGGGNFSDPGGGAPGSLPPPPSPVLPPDFESRSAVEAADIDNEVSFVRTAGYSVPGDGGGALYVRVAPEPGHELKIQSADGAFWELVAEGGLVTEKQAGGIGDGVADDTQAIQNAIDFAVYYEQNNGSAQAVEVRIIGPLCRTTDTIHIGYGEGFHGVVVRGVANKRRAETSNVGTAILASFTDRPIVNIQGARITEFSDIWLNGALPTTAIDFLGTEPTQESAWDALGGNGRYNPCAGITIDAYSGPRPAQSYPDATYPDFLQPIAQYDKRPSSDVIISRVGIQRVNTAIAVQPCDFDGNGDFLKIRDCNLDCCKYGISIGNSQSRNVEIRNVTGSEMFVFMTNSAHGKQVGRFGGPIENCSFGGYMGNVFRFNRSALLGTMLFQNFYAESLHRIGDMTGNSGSEGSITFESSQFVFRHNETTGVPPNILAGVNDTEMVFRGCAFSRVPSVFSMTMPNVQMEQCRTSVDGRASGTIDRYLAFAHNATSGGMVLDPFGLRPQGIGFTQFNLNTGAAIGSVLPREVIYRDSDRTTCIPIAIWDYRHKGELYGTTRRKRFPVFNRQKQTHFSSVSLANKTLTLVFQTLSDQEAMRQGVEAGDIIRDVDTGMVFFIRARTGTTVTAEAQNNFVSNGGGGFNTLEPFSTTTGTLQFMPSRLYTPGFTTLGDFTVGSNVAANAGRNDGFSAYLSTDIAVGDFLFADLDPDLIFSGGEAEVTGVNSAARTITFAGNARNAVGRKILPLWIRQPPPNS
ncbi:MAG: hypothetical protein AB8B85_22905 [Paracoccaceae bacterium]